MRRATALVAASLAAALIAGSTGSAPAARELRVGLVVGAGTEPGNRNIVALPYLGFLEAVRRFGVDGRVVRVAPNGDATSALTFLARQRYDLVVMADLNHGGTLDRVALAFPHVRFLLPDAPLATLPHRPRNVQGTDFRAGEAAYLAGYLAGLMERRRPGEDVVGSVGGFKFSGVDRWIVAFQAGARRAAPGITTLNAYTDDFVVAAKCRTAALSQIARGAGVLFQVAGACGLGTLEAAREKGVWGVGVDVDESYLGPHVLTSAIIRSDLSVVAAIERLVDGTFTTGGDTVFDLANGGVALGRISPEVPAQVRRRLERVRRAIVAGRIAVPRIS
ncbi:MAG TPA: BMP family ABC transporter substrate-binding protein [Gaiellaceae bacterium]|nr:BMP family ABC transporter substrate-binding protein [Gaiellaceae bacterium]